MTDERVNRKMSAILSADAKGYSRLMSADEEGTVKDLNACREIIAKCVQDHRGRVVDSPGDNVLAEFASTVEAVKCAVQIQNDFKVRNADLSEDRRMEFRIGVNLGDVIEAEGRIYGDGVNISARLETLADAGGVCISGTAFDQVKGKLSLGYQFVGEQTVKNIPDPIRVYKVLMDEKDSGKLIGVGKKAPKSRWAEIAAIVVFVAIGLVIYQFYVRSPAIELASVEKMAFPLPDNPSIAVLAFDNMSGDPEQEYFSDGIAENIITALSKVGELFVIARNSSFTYKGKPVKVKQVAEELGVRYVLEGSVRKSEDRVRITAQLIDATNGQHIWAENYDRDFKDIFEIQDEITIKIVTALQVELTEGEQARLYAAKTKNPDAKYKGMQARSYWRKGNKEGYIKVGQLAQEIIDMEPDSVLGYRWLAWHHYGLTTLGISPRENLKKAFKLSQKALSMDENDSLSHGLAGYVYLQMRKHEKAIVSGKRAVELAPNGALVHVLLGSTLSYAGHVDEAIVHLKQARRLNPFPAYFHYYHLGRCYIQKGQYEDALAEYKKGLQLSPDSFAMLLVMAATYALLDREEEARATAEKFLELNPNFSVTYYLKTSRFKNKDHTKLFADALRKAGFPE